MCTLSSPMSFRGHERLGDLGCNLQGKDRRQGALAAKVRFDRFAFD